VRPHSLGQPSRKTTCGGAALKRSFRSSLSQAGNIKTGYESCTGDEDEHPSCYDPEFGDSLWEPSSLGISLFPEGDG
jgi:hypothetical protein